MIAPEGRFIVLPAYIQILHARWNLRSAQDFYLDHPNFRKKRKNSDRKEFISPQKKEFKDWYKYLLDLQKPILNSGSFYFNSNMQKKRRLSKTYISAKVQLNFKLLEEILWTKKKITAWNSNEKHSEILFLNFKA